MPFAGSWREPPAPGGVAVLALRQGRPGTGNCTFGPMSGRSRTGGRLMFGNSPPPSRKIRFGLSAKMPLAPPYVHFSWPGSVLRSFGQPSCTSYGPEISSAPMAIGTALYETGGADAAVWASAGGLNSRLLAAMPTATPTANDNPTVTVLLMAFLPREAAKLFETVFADGTVLISLYPRCRPV
jgi:hypothetical protein